MRYSQQAPSADLRPFVACTWQLAVDPCRERGRAAGAGEPVLPDGRCEIVLHRGEPFEERQAAGWRRQEQALWVGPQLAPVTLRPTGRAEVFGIRFNPFGAAALLGLPVGDTRDEILPAGSVLPGLDRALQDAAEAALDAPDFGRRAETVLRQRLHLARRDLAVEEAVARLTRAEENPRMDELARELNLSHRHLERRFLRAVGMPPKRYARIARFHRLLRRLSAAERGHGAKVSADLGYADQSHAIREFREFCGLPPSSLLADPPLLTALFAGWMGRP